MFMHRFSDSVIKDLQHIVGKENIIQNADMKGFTTFRVGGSADFLTFPTSADVITSLLDFCSDAELPFFIIGKGSNLIVSDKGIRGVVISTLKLNSISIQLDTVTAECGTELSQLSSFTAANGLSGLEFACGIPGTVGGAVFMNAGAYEGEISKVLLSSLVLKKPHLATNNNHFIPDKLDNKSHDFSYRHSVFQDNTMIHLSSTFKLIPKKPRDIKNEIIRLQAAREAKQPMDLPSAGSVFRRPEGYFVGKLIQDSGLRGYRIGDAAVSDKHCGFIVNLGSASASDILALIEYIRSEVFNRFGVLLQTEVRFVGEP
jgi:UDP-N-acetylmuramate dehydrogenase